MTVVHKTSEYAFFLCDELSQSKDVHVLLVFYYSSH